MDWPLYLSLSIMMFLQYAIWGAWAPVLSSHLVGPLKLSGKQTGWIYATLWLGCIVALFTGGQIADRPGRRVGAAVGGEAEEFLAFAWADGGVRAALCPHPRIDKLCDVHARSQPESAGMDSCVGHHWLDSCWNSTYGLAAFGQTENPWQRRLESCGDSITGHGPLLPVPSRYSAVQGAGRPFGVRRGVQDAEGAEFFGLSCYFFCGHDGAAVLLRPYRTLSSGPWCAARKCLGGYDFGAGG